MTTDRKLYDLLGVGPTATRDEVKSAYWALAKSLHPDSAGPGKEEEFAAVYDAYVILIDDEKRAEYDRTGFIDVKANNDRGKMLTALGNIFCSLLAKYQGGIQNVNLLTEMRNQIAEDTQKIQAQLNNLGATATILRNLSAKVIAPKGSGDSMFHNMMQGQIGEVEEAIKKLTPMLELHYKLEAELRPYESMEQYFAGNMTNSTSSGPIYTYFRV